MGKGLEGKRIVIAGSRKTEEMSAIIEKQGGTALVRPLQGTVFLAEEEVGSEIKELISTQVDWVIFTTGIGTEALVETAGKLGIKEDFLQVIQHAKVAVRGYKTFAALKKLGVTPAATDDDGTTAGLIRALDKEDLVNKRVAVQLHGEKAPALMAFLDKKGAEVQCLLPYRHHAPEEETVGKLLNEVLNKEVDVVCFTTAIQVRSLFDYAKQTGRTEELLSAFTASTLAGAVGKVTAEALTEEGVTRMVVPELERMGAMIMELSRFYKELN
ncbi:uroporphyrinogen-III synthase [Bacillus aerolatus]|uniref:Uroporphyrinogen-III synthase n=1 Tax=Bacillus aerolatus TaxID=2653354 RepID=A0A6I1FLJ8_9BACI|nr:uroporphyrinogen-III synthase [Bacillus aerolatus]KAB7707839.1 uroporphyrinogen-III synthase [Bacillus aerolatus]